MEMLSLFDYLGHPAGRELGKLVYQYACLRHCKEMGVKPVETKNYKGEVMVYSKEFLDEFFAVSKLFDNFFTNELQKTYNKLEELNTLLSDDFEIHVMGNMRQPVDDLPF